MPCALISVSPTKKTGLLEILSVILSVDGRSHLVVCPSLATDGNGQCHDVLEEQHHSILHHQYAGYLHHSAYWPMQFHGLCFHHCLPGKYRWNSRTMRPWTWSVCSSCYFLFRQTRNSIDSRHQDDVSTSIDELFNTCKVNEWFINTSRMHLTSNDHATKVFLGKCNCLFNRSITKFAVKPLALAMGI